MMIETHCLDNTNDLKSSLRTSVTSGSRGSLKPQASLYPEIAALSLKPQASSLYPEIAANIPLLFVK